MALDNLCRFKGEITSLKQGMTETGTYYVLFSLKVKNGISGDGKPHYQSIPFKRFSKEPIPAAGLEKGCYVEAEGCLRTEYKKEGNVISDKKYVQWYEVLLLKPEVEDKIPQKTIVVDITGQNNIYQQPEHKAVPAQEVPPLKTPERQAQKGDEIPFDDYDFPDKAPF